MTGEPWPAPAKLNLFLHVVGQRADGFHELQTVFQLIDLADSLHFVPRTDGEIRRVGGRHASVVTAAYEGLQLGIGVLLCGLIGGRRH